MDLRNWSWLMALLQLQPGEPHPGAVCERGSVGVLQFGGGEGLNLVVVGRVELPDGVVVQPERCRHPVAEGVAVQHPGCPERGQLPDPLAAVDEPALLGLGAQDRQAALPADDEVGMLGLVPGHAVAVVGHDDLTVLRPGVTEGHGDPDLRRVGVPCVGDQLGDGRGDTRVKLRPQLLDQRPTEAQDQPLRGHPGLANALS
jgi:hypothetical protein